MSIPSLIFEDYQRLFKEKCTELKQGGKKKDLAMNHSLILISILSFKKTLKKKSTCAACWDNDLR